jgi:hypothetical protein
MKLVMHYHYVNVNLEYEMQSSLIAIIHFNVKEVRVVESKLINSKLLLPSPGHIQTQYAPDFTLYHKTIVIFHDFML